MIRYDPELGLVQMDLGDLEHCGFDHTAFDGELFLVGIEEPAARWPLALIVNFAGGHVVGPATDAAVMQQRRGAQATFELWLTRWRASSPESLPVVWARHRAASAAATDGHAARRAQ